MNPYSYIDRSKNNSVRRTVGVPVCVPVCVLFLNNEPAVKFKLHKETKYILTRDLTRESKERLKTQLKLM